MRFGIPLAIAGILLAGEARGQESIPLPLPEPVPPQFGPQAPAAPSTLPPAVPIPPPPGVPAGGSPPYGPYGPPPGYGPYGPLPPGSFGAAPGGYGYGPPPGPYGPPAPVYGRPRIYAGDPVHDPRIWMNLDSLIWWSKSQPLSVPLITTGPAALGSNAGAIGAPGTVSLNQPLNYGAGGGIRINVGGWLTTNHVWGVEGNVFSLGQQNAGFSVTDRAGNGSLVLNEPVVGAPFVTQVSAPGIETGAVNVHSWSELWGAEVNGLYNLVRRGGMSVNLLAGFRYLELEEAINIKADSGLFVPTTYTDNMGNTLASAPPGSTVTVGDHFGTRNQFYGGQGGVKFIYVSDRWSFSGTATVALGATQSKVNVSGYTDVYPINSDMVSLTGGNYATLQTGTYSKSHFAVAPGVQMNLGYQFTPFVRGIIGYNFLYLSSVVRPGNQIDNLYDGVNRPTVPFVNSSFWAQGINLGFQVSF